MDTTLPRLSETVVAFQDMHRHIAATVCLKVESFTTAL
jgi:hypothetical protein